MFLSTGRTGNGQRDQQEIDMGKAMNLQGEVAFCLTFAPHYGYYGGRFFMLPEAVRRRWL